MRGFASAVAFALAVVALAAAASLVVQLGAGRQASVTALEALQLGWRFNDTANFLSGTANDAFSDAGYQSCGCAANSPSTINATLGSLTKSYFANASETMSDFFYATKLENVYASSISASSCNFSTRALFYVITDVRSPNSARRENVSFSRTLAWSKTASLVSFNITEGTRIHANVNVTCG